MAKNILDSYIDSIGVNVDVENGIVDRTSLVGMTPQAIQNLRAAIKGAADAGLAKIVITAGKGGGHLSHGSGTEWDIKGLNADGSKWTNAQRIAVAAAAKAAGADRFGIYEMSKGLGKGTLHIGVSGPGRPPGMWGANGLTSGPKARKFNNPVEAAFAAGKDVPVIAEARAPRLTPSMLAKYAKDTAAMPIGYDAPQISPTAQYARAATEAALTPSAVEQAGRRALPPAGDNRFSGPAWDGGSSIAISPADLSRYIQTGRGGNAPIGEQAPATNRFNGPAFQAQPATPLSAALSSRVERANAPPAGPVSGLSTASLADAVVSPPSLSSRFNGPAFSPPDRSNIASALSRYVGRRVADAPTSVKGMVEPGNIDLSHRPVVRNSDGSISTVRSMSFEEDGKEVLVPTISPSGVKLTDKGAIALYQATGANLGKFKTVESADQYARALHNEQERQYVAPAKTSKSDRFSGPAFDSSRSSGSLTPSSLAAYAKSQTPAEDRFSGPAYSPPASSGITPSQVRQYATQAAMTDRFSDQNFNPPAAQSSLQPSTLAAYVRANAAPVQEDRFSDLSFKPPTSQPGLSTALSEAARRYANPQVSVAGQAPPAPAAAPAIDVTSPAPTLAPPTISNEDFNARWSTQPAVMKPVVATKPVVAPSPAPAAVNAPAQQDEQAPKTATDPWAATPKLFRPQFGLGLVGGMLGNALIGPGGGILGKIAGKEIGKRLTPTELPELTQKLGEGLAAIQAVQSGAAQLGPGQYVAARNVPAGYRVGWSYGPNGQPMQTAWAPSGRTYSTYSIGPSLSPMEVTVYGGNPATDKVQKDRSSSSSGGYTTTTGNLY